MATTQVKFSNTTDVSTMTSAEISKLTVAEIGAFTKLQQEALTPEHAAGLSDKQVAALPTKYVSPDVYTGLTTKALAGLPIKAMSVDQFAALTPTQMNALNSSQTALVSAKQWAEVSADGIGALSTGAKGGLAGIVMKNLGDNFSLLNEGQVAQLSAEQIKGITAKQAGAITSEQAGAFTDKQAAEFTPSLMKSFSDDAVGGLTSKAIGAIPPKSIAALTIGTSGNIDSLGEDNIIGLNSAQLAALKSTQIAALSSNDDLQFVTTGTLVGLTKNNISGLDLTKLAGDGQFAALKASQIANFSTTQIASIDATGAEALTSAVLAAMSSTQLAKLSATDVLPNIAPEAFTGLTAKNIKGLTSSQIKEMLPEQAEKLVPAAVKSFTADQVAGFESEDFAALTPQAVKAIKPTTLAEVAPTVFAALSADQIQALSGAQMAKLQADQILKLAPEQTEVLSPAQVAKIDATIINQMPSESLAALPAAAAAKISDLSDFTSAQVFALTDEQAAKLTVAQLQTLSYSGATAGIKGLSATHVGNDNMRTLSGLSSNQIQALSTNAETGAIPALTTKQMGKFTATELSYFTPVMANSLSDDVVDWATGTKRYAVVESATGLHSDAGTTTVAGIQTNTANVQGTTAADKITSGSAHDTINGNGGADSIDSGAGNDVIQFSSGAEISATGTISGGDGNDSISIDTTNITDIDDADFAHVTGVEVFNLYTGTNTAVLGTNAQTAGIVTVNGGTGADTITMSAYTTANVSVSGGSGADIITTGSGADTITGGVGNDSMTGGEGSDVFVFAAGSVGATPTSSVLEVISDWNTSGDADKIDFGTTALTFVTQSTTAVDNTASIASGIATFHSADTTVADRLVAAEAALAAGGTATAGQTVVFRQDSDSYVFISDGTDGVGANDVLIKLENRYVSSATITSGDLTVDAGIVYTANGFNTNASTLNASDSIYVVDTAANVTTRLADLVTNVGKLDLIVVTDGSTNSVNMTASQFNSLDGVLQAGDTIKIIDTGAGINAEIANLATNVSKIDAINANETTNAINMTASQFNTLDGVLDAGDTIKIVDTGTNITSEIANLNTNVATINQIDASDTNAINMAYAQFNEFKAKVVSGDNIQVVDTASAITTGIATLATHVANIDLIDATAGDSSNAITMNYSQFNELKAKISTGDYIKIVDDAANVTVSTLVSQVANIDLIDVNNALNMTASQFNTLDGVLQTADTINIVDSSAGIEAELANLVTNVAKIDAINSGNDDGANAVDMTASQFNSLKGVVDSSDVIKIVDTGTNITTEIATLNANASQINTIDASDSTAINVTFAQFDTLKAKVATGDNIQVVDTASAITTGIATLATHVANIDLIDATAGDSSNAITMNYSQFNELKAKVSTDDYIKIVDTGEALDATAIGVLAAQATNIDMIDASNSTAFNLSVSEYSSLSGKLTTGDTIQVVDTTANIEGTTINFTTNGIDGLSISSGTLTFAAASDSTGPDIGKDLGANSAALAGAADVTAATEWHFNTTTKVLTYWDGDSAAAVTLTGVATVTANGSALLALA